MQPAITRILHRPRPSLCIRSLFRLRGTDSCAPRWQHVMQVRPHRTTDIEGTVVAHLRDPSSLLMGQRFLTLKSIRVHLYRRRVVMSAPTDRSPSFFRSSAPKCARPFTPQFLISPYARWSSTCHSSILANIGLDQIWDYAAIPLFFDRSLPSGRCAHLSCSSSRSQRSSKATTSHQQLRHMRFRP